MKAIIIEDEKAAVRNLTSLLGEVCPQIEIVTELDSIADTIEWFTDHSMPDLVFMDIHLADGSAFEIFEHVHITCPIIFTTAYDEYALRAFKVNSIDYLLKPIGRQDIEQALEKLTLFSSGNSKPTGPETNELVNLMRMLKKQESYKTHFLIPIKGDKLLPVSVDMILLFYIRDCQVKAVLTDGIFIPTNPRRIDRMSGPDTLFPGQPPISPFTGSHQGYRPLVQQSSFHQSSSFGIRREDFSQ